MARKLECPPDSLIEMREMRASGHMPRESYWAVVQEHLSSMQVVAELIDPDVLTLSTEAGEVVLTATIEGTSAIRLLVDPSDMRSAAVTLVAEGRYEPLELQLMLAAAQTATTFIDVGANAGFYSLAIAAASPQTRVTAIEPNKGVFETLIRNIKLSHLEQRVSVLNVGLSRAPQEKVTLYVPARTGTGGGSLVDLHPDEGAAIEHEVRLSTLDEVCEGIRPDLLKVDVEGAEMEVLAGGTRVLMASRPTILIELLRKWMKPFGAHPQEVVEMLHGLDYACYAIGNGSIRRTEEINAETQETNFLFVHPSRSGFLCEFLDLDPTRAAPL